MAKKKSVKKVQSNQNTDQALETPKEQLEAAAKAMQASQKAVQEAVENMRKTLSESVTDASVNQQGVNSQQGLVNAIENESLKKTSK